MLHYFCINPIKTGTLLVQWLKSYDKNGKKIVVFEKNPFFMLETSNFARMCMNDHFNIINHKKDIWTFLAIFDHFFKNLKILLVIKKV